MLGFCWDVFLLFFLTLITLVFLVLFIPPIDSPLPPHVGYISLRPPQMPLVGHFRDLFSTFSSLLFQIPLKSDIQACVLLLVNDFALMIRTGVKWFSKI